MMAHFFQVTRILFCSALLNNPIDKWYLFSSIKALGKDECIITESIYNLNEYIATYKVIYPAIPSDKLINLCNAYLHKDK